MMSEECSPEFLDEGVRILSPVLFRVAIRRIRRDGITDPESIRREAMKLVMAGAIGWFRNVLPHEAHEATAVLPGEQVIATSRREVARVLAGHQPQRVWLPERTR